MMDKAGFLDLLGRKMSVPTLTWLWRVPAKYSTSRLGLLNSKLQVPGFSAGGNRFLPNLNMSQMCISSAIRCIDSVAYF